MLIKVQYDAVLRTFKLVVPEYKTILEGDGLYDLAIPVELDEGAEEFFSAAGMFVAHA